MYRLFLKKKKKKRNWPNEDNTFLSYLSQRAALSIKWDMIDKIENAMQIIYFWEIPIGRLELANIEQTHWVTAIKEDHNNRVSCLRRLLEQDLWGSSSLYLLEWKKFSVGPLRGYEGPCKCESHAEWGLCGVLVLRKWRGRVSETGCMFSYVICIYVQFWFYLKKMKT